MRETYDITLSGGLKGAKPKNVAKKKYIRDDLWLYLGIAGQVGYIVAIPLALGAIGGSFVDSRFGVHPKGIYTGLTLGFIVSVIGFINLIRELLKQQDKKN